MRPAHRPSALLLATIALSACLFLRAAPSVRGQDTATPAAATATLTATPFPGTPTPSRTPTQTPTATATFTALQAKLALAQVYLRGGEYSLAAGLFAQIAEADRGNAEALLGLESALAGQAAATATAAAPPRTAAATVAPPELEAGPAISLSDWLRQLGGLALALLLVLTALWVLSGAARWLLFGLREFVLTRVLGWFRRPNRSRGFRLGDIREPGAPLSPLPELFAAALAGEITRWNQLMVTPVTPLEPGPPLDLGRMGWLELFWRWFVPRSRHDRIDVVLSRGVASTTRASVQRVSLATGKVRRSATFEAFAASPEDTVRILAGEAAKWLLVPETMEVAGTATVAVGSGEERQGASRVYGRAMALLLPLRQQVALGQINYPEARRSLHEAELLVEGLPEESDLRLALGEVIAGLRQSVPGDVTGA